MTIDRKVKPVRAVERGLDVFLELQRRRGASLHELHLALGLPKATLLRMLVTLSSRGMIWQRLADGAYLPSLVRQPAGPPDLATRLAEVASPELAELSERVYWPSALSVPRLDHIEIVETNSAIARIDAAMLGPVGAKLSYIHTATGRAYLAACGPVERAAILDRLRPPDATPASERALAATLEEIRTRGWSSRDPPHPWPDRSRADVVRDGRRSIAVAVRLRGEPVGAVNVTWPARRVSTESVVERYYPALRDAVERIGQALAASEPGFNG